jgi:predicted nucleic acid-binding protein
MQFLFEAATQISIDLDRPAYDCVYLSLAVENKCHFFTADERLPRKIYQYREATLLGSAVSLIEAVK